MKDQDAYNFAVTDKSNELMATVHYNRAYGFTPEQQNATRAAMKSRADVDAAEAQGMTVSQYRAQEQKRADEGSRADLISKLTDWGVATEQPKLPGFLTQVATGAQPGQKRPSQLPQGWSAAQLLTQPGMSLEAAQDLYSRITSGVGTIPYQAPPSPAQQMGAAAQPWNRNAQLFPMPPKAGQSPYMPGAGVQPVAPRPAVPTKLFQMPGAPAPAARPVPRPPAALPTTNPAMAADQARFGLTPPKEAALPSTNPALNADYQRFR
jgi:hypothetical protein